MKFKKGIIASILLGMSVAMAPSSASAEYITAVEEMHYEKYVVDTTSLYFPDPKHKTTQFNFLVRYYTSPTDKGKPLTFRYKFEKDKWLLAEKDGDKLVWEPFDDTSPAADILRVIIPYLNHTGNEINKTQER